MRPGERHRLLHPPHHPCPDPLLPTIPLYNIPKSASHLTRQRAHLGNAGLDQRGTQGLRTMTHLRPMKPSLTRAYMNSGPVV